MKTLVAYFSVSGQTKKVAEAISQEIKGEKEIKPLSEVTDLEGYTLSFIGMPIHGFGPPQEVGEFLAKKGAGKNIALFITHAAPEDMGLLPEWLAKCRDAAAGTNLLGLFHCQGELAKDVADAMAKSNNPGLVAYAKSRPLTLGQPDATRLERARAFAREIMAKVT